MHFPPREAPPQRQEDLARLLDEANRAFDGRKAELVDGALQGAVAVDFEYAANDPGELGGEDDFFAVGWVFDIEEAGGRVGDERDEVIACAAGLVVPDAEE